MIESQNSASDKLGGANVSQYWASLNKIDMQDDYGANWKGRKISQAVYIATIICHEVGWHLVAQQSGHVFMKSAFIDNESFSPPSFPMAFSQQAQEDIIARLKIP